MKTVLKLEELGLFLLALFLFSQLDYAWWLYALLFLAPDLSMIAYLAGPRVGAIVYDVVHHKGVAVVFYVAGALLDNQPLQLIGLIILGHSSMDRIFGYGLKYEDSFQHTHLGMIGKQQNA